MAQLEARASEPPRKIVALPDLRQSAAASAVTFGRACPGRGHALMARLAYEPITHLLQDDVDAARHSVEQSKRRGEQMLESSTFRYILMLTEARIERYAGRGMASWGRFLHHGPAIARSLMMSRQPIRLFVLPDRATSALLAARELVGARRLGLEAAALADIRRVRWDSADWGKALIEPAAAGLAAARGRKLSAIRQLEQAERELDSLGMLAMAHVCRFRRGELVGDGVGDQLCDEAVASLRTRGIGAPERMAGLLAAPTIGWR